MNILTKKHHQYNQKNLIIMEFDSIKFISSCILSILFMLIILFFLKIVTEKIILTIRGMIMKQDDESVTHREKMERNHDHEDPEHLNDGHFDSRDYDGHLELENTVDKRFPSSGNQSLLRQRKSGKIKDSQQQFDNSSSAPFHSEKRGFDTISSLASSSSLQTSPSIMATSSTTLMTSDVSVSNDNIETPGHILLETNTNFQLLKQVQSQLSIIHRQLLNDCHDRHSINLMTRLSHLLFNTWLFLLDHVDFTHLSDTSRRLQTSSTSTEKLHKLPLFNLFEFIEDIHNLVHMKTFFKNDSKDTHLNRLDCGIPRCSFIIKDSFSFRHPSLLLDSLYTSNDDVQDSTEKNTISFQSLIFSILLSIQYMKQNIHEYEIRSLEITSDELICLNKRFCTCIDENVHDSGSRSFSARPNPNSPSSVIPDLNSRREIVIELKFSIQGDDSNMSQTKLRESLTHFYQNFLKEYKCPLKLSVETYAATSAAATGSKYIESKRDLQVTLKTTCFMAPPKCAYHANLKYISQFNATHTVPWEILCRLESLIKRSIIHIIFVDEIPCPLLQSWIKACQITAIKWSEEPGKFMDGRNSGSTYIQTINFPSINYYDIEAICAYQSFSYKQFKQHSTHSLARPVLFFILSEDSKIPFIPSDLEMEFYVVRSIPSSHFTEQNLKEHVVEKEKLRHESFSLHQIQRPIGPIEFLSEIARILDFAIIKTDEKVNIVFQPSHFSEFKSTTAIVPTFNHSQDMNSLPAVTRRIPSVSAIDNNNYDSIYTTSSESSPRMPISTSSKVLIVEDNVVNQRVLTKFFEKKGISAEVASNGLEAIQKIEKEHYEFVLMDILMPVMDGIQATKIIREMSHVKPEVRDLIIIALTASTSVADRDAALSAGCNDFLLKPIGFNFLERKLAEWGSIRELIDIDQHG